MGLIKQEMFSLIKKTLVVYTEHTTRVSETRNIYVSRGPTYIFATMEIEAADFCLFKVSSNRVRSLI